MQDIFGEINEKLHELPGEIGTELVGQVKGNQQQQNKGQGKQPDPAAASQQQQQFLNDLYGTSQMTPEQIEMKKKQDARKQISNYQRIQQEIQAYRAKKQQEKTKYEIGWQEGTVAARDREEEMELWEEQKKKAEEKKKKEKAMNTPGSAQSRSGEKGKIMG